MSTMIQKYRDAEAQIAALQKQLAQMEPEVKNIKDLQVELQSMADAAGINHKDAALLLWPKFAEKQEGSSAAEKTPRRARAIKVYDNPHTGELVETKGGNHKTLKAWKQQYGGDVVESWLRK